MCPINVLFLLSERRSVQIKLRRQIGGETEEFKFKNIRDHENISARRIFCFEMQNFFLQNTETRYKRNKTISNTYLHILVRILQNMWLYFPLFLEDTSIFYQSRKQRWTSNVKVFHIIKVHIGIIYERD